MGHDSSVNVRHALLPPRGTLSCLHVALYPASTWHSILPARGTLSCLHVALYPASSGTHTHRDSSSLSNARACAARSERTLEFVDQVPPLLITAMLHTKQ